MNNKALDEAFRRWKKTGDGDLGGQNLGDFAVFWAGWRYCKANNRKNRRKNRINKKK